MKVTIRDKDALAALSWEALRTYLERAGWEHADDIGDKAVVYQRSVNRGRLWEILVPLRTDLADYAARMGDAVSVLARIEHRSELDVYEDLRRLGAQSSEVDDATRAVHDKIRRWLAEEGWHVRDASKPDWPLNIVVTVDGGQTVEVFQHRDSFGRVTVSQGWTFSDDAREDFSKIPKEVQRDVIYNIYRDVMISGLDLVGLDVQLTQMRYGSFIYFDGITKELLMQRIHRIVRMHHLTMRTFDRGFALIAQVDNAAVRSNNVLMFPILHAAAV